MPDFNNTGRSFAPLVNILADDPSALADLKSLVQNCSPHDGNHIFWVDHDGMVHVVPNAPPPSGWQAPASLRGRLHSIGPEDSMVGHSAAADNDAMTTLLGWLRTTYRLALGNETPDLDGLV
jgi:hypothetical protein